MPNNPTTLRHVVPGRRLLAGLAGLLACVGVGDRPVGAADEAPLRYRWKAGQTYAYAVTVEVDHGDYLDVLSGTPTYTVQKVDPDGAKLLFRGALTEKQQAKPGKRIIFRPGRTSPFSPFTGVGGAGRGSELTVNDRGEVVSAQGSSQLPYLLGNLSQLPLVPLPKEGERSWKVTRDTAITLAEGRLPRPTLRDSDRKQLKAVHETSYAVEQATKDRVTINKRSELKTSETAGGKPRFEILGQGQLTFDLQAGVPATLEYQQQLYVREGNAAEETPLKITVRLLDEAERAKLAGSAPGAALFPNEPLSEAQQTQVVADLTSGDKGRTLKGLSLLQGKEPGQPNPNVAKALESLLADKDQTLRFSASRALSRWATPETLPALVKALDDDNVSVRHNALDALGRLKSETAAEPVARKLSSLQDRFKASQALQAMGPAAEPAVLKAAEDREWMVRSEVCKILKAIGTEKSVPTLRALQNDPQALVKVQAKQALDAIAARK